MLSKSVVVTENDPSPTRFFQPYADFDADFLYNALFCDSLSLLRRDLPVTRDATWAAVLAEPLPLQDLLAIAADAAVASRLRALACWRLRAGGRAVGIRSMLGVVAELPFAAGQDTLAAYADGSVRHIRHCGAAACFDSPAVHVAARARKFVAVAERLLQRFAAPQPHRLAPPQDGRIRITLLASDGSYCCEGPFAVLQKDPLAGPVLGNAIWLLQAQAQAAPD